MALVLGRVPKAASRSVLGSLKARFSDAGRQQVEFEEGEGLFRLLGLLKALSSHVTAVVRPSLGFMDVDGCAASPGRLLVVNTLHWSGDVAADETGAWTGFGGRVGLGRPDRRAHAFADRLSFSGRVDGFHVRAAVIVTGGPVRLLGADPEAEVVQWAEAARWLQGALDSTDGPDPTTFIESLLGQ